MLARGPRRAVIAIAIVIVRACPASTITTTIVISPIIIIITIITIITIVVVVTVLRPGSIGLPNGQTDRGKAKTQQHRHRAEKETVLHGRVLFPVRRWGVARCVLSLYG